MNPDAGVGDPAKDPEIIAAHEAGHAVVAHLLGLTIRTVELLPNSNTSARVGLTFSEIQQLRSVDQRRLAFSGGNGEVLGGGSLSGHRVAADLGVVQDWDAPVEDHGIESSRNMLLNYRNAWAAVRDLILQALDGGSVSELGGGAVHALIESHAAPFGSQRSP